MEELSCFPVLYICDVVSVIFLFYLLYGSNNQNAGVCEGILNIRGVART
jgi:hypothetical protein